MSEHVVKVDGADIQVSDRGEGPVLVLLHGGLDTAAQWDPVASRLGAAFRVIAPTMRAHGRSTNDGRALSYPQLAEDVATLIDELSLDRPLVGGWSDGGQVALELGARYPGLAGAFVFGGAYPEFVHSGLRALHEQLAASLSEPDEELDRLAEQHADWDWLLRSSTEMWVTYAGLPDAGLERISAPALVLAADGDELVGLELSRRLQGELAEAELAVLPGTSHEGALAEDRADLLAAVIADFARRSNDDEGN